MKSLSGGMEIFAGMEDVKHAAVAALLRQQWQHFLQI